MIRYRLDTSMPVAIRKAFAKCIQEDAEKNNKSLYWDYGGSTAPNVIEEKFGCTVTWDETGTVFSQDVDI